MYKDTTRRDARQGTTPGAPWAPLKGVGGDALVGTLALLSTVSAASSGVLFTASGLKADGYSAGMATMFLLTFSFHFILVCILLVRLRGLASR